MMDNYLLRQKLKWRSRRSMLELDLYFERFLQSEAFNFLSDQELNDYARLLVMDDGDLLFLFQQKNKLSDIGLQSLIDKIVSAPSIEH